MGKSLCIVVANASMAHCFECVSVRGPFETVACLVHPESRMHGRELSDDSPGHGPAARAAMAKRSTAKERERSEFAREVAGFLRSGVDNNRYDRIVLFASAAFLGELMSRLDGGVRSLVQDTHTLDLTALPQHEIETRVRGVLWG